MNANMRGIRVIYLFEMARFGRTFWTSLLMPVVTTSLYFVVFGSAIGSRMTDVSSVPYGAFIVPGLMMLTMFTESISNASFRSEEHTSELQSLMRISYAVFCLKKKKVTNQI